MSHPEILPPRWEDFIAMQKERDRYRDALEKYAALEGWDQGSQTGFAAYTWAREALHAKE